MSVTALTERVFRVRQPDSALDKAALRGVSSVDHTSAGPQTRTRVCPYRSLIACAAKGMSSNSTKHMGPLIF